MTRKAYIERILRDIYGGYVNQDSEITVGFINNLIPEALALAAKQNFNDTLQLDGIAVINNSFYTTFKNLAITEDEYFTYKITLPQIPPGLGSNEGIASVKIKDANGNLSYECLPMTANQAGIMQGLRKGAEEIWYLNEGEYCLLYTTVILTPFTAQVRMVSGGDATDLTSTLTCPPDYLPIMDMFLIKKGKEQRGMFKDSANDAIDSR